MKKTNFLFRSALSLLLLSAIFLFQACSDDDDSEPAEPAIIIRLVTVNPGTESVTLRNFGTTEVSVADFQLCLGAGQYNVLSNYISITGDLSLSPEETVTFDLTSGSQNVTDLPIANGGLGLFSTGGQFDSSDPAILLDYIQWGAADQNRVDQAVAAGRWDDADNFVSGFEIYSYNGEANDVGSTFWGTINAADIRLRSGFVVNAQTPEGSHFVKYFPSLPSGSVDVSDGTDFRNFFPPDLFDGALYNARPDGSEGFSKIMVNGNGEVIEDSFISVTEDESFQIAIKDATTGVLQDRNFPNQITVFDPTTMTKVGEIDMSAGLVPGGIPQRYQTFYFRGDEVLAPIRGNAGEIYDSLVVHIASLTSGTYVASASVNSGPAAPFNDFGQHYLNENGDLFVPDQGDVFTGNPASLHRIPAGANDFDDFDFKIASVLNPANVFLPIFRGFYYVGNGTALALVATETPQAVIDLVTSVGGPQNLSDAQIQQVLGILFSSENGRWCRIDLNNETVVPIPGLPAQSPFSAAAIMEDDGKLFFPITTTSINALYSWDPQTDNTEKVFDLTVGGSLVGVYNLSNNN